MCLALKSQEANLLCCILSISSFAYLDFAINIILNSIMSEYRLIKTFTFGESSAGRAVVWHFYERMFTLRTRRLAKHFFPQFKLKSQMFVYLHITVSSRILQIFRNNIDLTVC